MPNLASGVQAMVVDTPTRTGDTADRTAVATAAADQVGTLTTADRCIQALADSFHGDPAKAFALSVMSQVLVSTGRASP
jgi:hypothetical protein